ncbi:hemerythrin domain-containing protein [Balneatrix alpica]|uniref:Hemerythrin domain-containing protein n=1 Tax=Balneatrix alpica TaxID=75684 RepID=A0ABV5ZDB3_9GAMM|nr:hemerythrin domain-containing protein [Balneatrix alpica]
MPRQQALQPFSHDHHQALVMCLRLERALQRAEARPLWAWVRESFTELELHFIEEELQLLPALLAVGEQALVSQLVVEHARLRLLVRQGDLSAAQQFATLLRAHVRFEERQVFPRIEELVQQGRLHWQAGQLCQGAAPLAETGSAF